MIENVITAVRPVTFQEIVQIKERDVEEVVAAVDEPVTTAVRLAICREIVQMVAVVVVDDEVVVEEIRLVTIVMK